MGYIARVHVTISNSTFRNALVEIINGLGSRNIVGYHNKDNCDTIGLSPTWVGYFPKDGVVSTKSINCNQYADSEEDAVELFLELAKLTDDKKYIGQWRIKSKDIFQLTEANITSHWCINSKVLTPIKLAENWKQIKESNGRYLQKIRG